MGSLTRGGPLRISPLITFCLPHSSPFHTHKACRASPSCSAAGNPSVSVAATAVDLSDPATRRALAEQYGFDQIGAPVPAGVTLQDVVNSLPPEVNRPPQPWPPPTAPLSWASFRGT